MSTTCISAAGAVGAVGTAPRGIIFDLDGTLVDSFADIAAALNATRSHFGLPALALTAVRAKVGRGSPALVRALVPVAAPHGEEALQVYLRRYEASALQSTRLLPGVAEVIDHFAARPLAVVSNKEQHLSRLILQGLGLWERFRIVLGGDSLPRRKPDPLPILHVLACFALRPEEALLVGDGLPDVAAGQAAGVPTVAVASGVESRESLRAAGPACVIDRLDEMIALYP